MKVAVGYRNVWITVTFLASVNEVISYMYVGVNGTPPLGYGDLICLVLSLFLCAQFERKVSSVSGRDAPPQCYGTMVSKVPALCVSMHSKLYFCWLDISLKGSVVAVEQIHIHSRHVTFNATECLCPVSTNVYTSPVLPAVLRQANSELI